METINNSKVIRRNFKNYINSFIQYMDFEKIKEKTGLCPFQLAIERFLNKNYLFCIHCGRVSTSLYGLSCHEKRCSLNPQRVPFNAPKWTEDQKRSRSLKLREIALARNFGGHNFGAGGGKKGVYKGFYCESSWELAFVIYHLDHNIPFKRCELELEYEYEGETHKYNPDFVIDNKIIEIKGYADKKAKAKAAKYPDIIVLDENKIKPYIDYAKKTYGRDFTYLYESAGIEKKIYPDKELVLEALDIGKPINIKDIHFIKNYLCEVDHKYGSLSIQLIIGFLKNLGYIYIPIADFKKYGLSKPKNNSKPKNKSNKKPKGFKNSWNQYLEKLERNFQENWRAIEPFYSYPPKYGWIYEASQISGLSYYQIVKTCMHFGINYHTLRNKPLKNPTKGNIWITNGKENKIWSPEEKMPEGYYKGRILKKE